ncbi:MAG TPA: hypothetical protein VK105_06235 [Virgibacillus sp.]|nr:hypothetical protein [Virgibacillus sp.]HLR66725.1 hypothetical protein [Virgibacillus sp.]
MADVIIPYQWEIFISLEIFSWLSLILFLVIRYAFRRQALGMLFLFIFIAGTMLEGVLAFGVYKKTGEIETFQIIITIFILYACTFGISDFKKLDRFMKQKIGKWKGVELLTEKDRRIMRRENDPRFIARKYRLGWYVHTFVFVVVHSFFWVYFGDHSRSLVEVLSDWSWMKEMDGVPENGPYQKEVIYPISVIWGIVFAADTINAWYYTIFPEKDKKNPSA